MTEIELTGEKNYRLEQGEQDLIVKSGSVRIFLQPMDGDRLLRRKFLGIAVQGEVIPAPPSEMTDGRKWALLCQPINSAVLTRADALPADVNIDDYLEDSVFRLEGDSGQLEIAVKKRDFWKTVIDRYDFRNSEREKGIQERFEKHKMFRLDTVRRMQNSFNSHLHYEIAAMEYTDSPLYDAMVFLCRRRNTPIAPLQRIRKACTGEPGIREIARVSGFACRKIQLDSNWKKTIYEPFLALVPDADGGPDRPVVCFRNFRRYYLYDTTERSYHRLTDPEEKQLTGEAWTILRPFDRDPVNLKSILHFCAGEVSLTDIFLLLLTMFMVTQIGLLLSNLNKTIYDRAIPHGDLVLSWTLGGLFIVGLTANLLFSIGQNLTQSRMTKQMTHLILTAVYDRAFHMPEQFFRGQESAAMAYRIYYLPEMYVSVIQSGVQIFLQMIFSIFYVVQMFSYSSHLAGIGLGMTVLQIILTAIRSVLGRKNSSRRIGRLMQTRSMLYQTFSNIETVRAAGAEEQLLYRYMENKTDIGRIRQQGDRIEQISAMALTMINGLMLILLYGVMGSDIGISLGSFMAFLTANTLFGTAMTQSAMSAISLALMMPMLKDATGVLREIPEKAGQGQIPDRLTGDIVLSNVSYSYEQDGKKILDDLSLHIRSGEYIGIAGVSGSGKSTLIRLLLGFNQPDMGQIYYDSIPISHLDRTELRRRIGSVLQDSALISGTILQNVTLSRPEATEEEVWQVLDQAAIRQEVETMPLGLMTHVSEENPVISGGQKQRILLARALLGNPQLMILDEATSALDNPTQEKVVSIMDSLSVTRIAVAHRLSTLRSCDRILLMDQGKIIEEGTYDSLMERKGKFYEMVHTQKND